VQAKEVIELSPKVPSICPVTPYILVWVVLYCLAHAVQAKEVAELSSNVAQLSRRVARITGGPGGALTNTERALAAAQAELREELQQLAAQFAACEASDAAATAAAAAQQEMQVRFVGKACKRAEM
jgi:hypothetical protein